jgi:hypothetical protein
MFSLSVIEHLRLDFGLVVQNYSVHARAAERLASLALKVKVAVLTLSGLASASIVLSLFRPARPYQIAAAVLAATAFAAHAAMIAYGIDGRIASHRHIAHRLWLMCERYRALLNEIQDGLVDKAALLQRRDALTEQVHAIYEQGFPIDQRAYESARQLPPENGGGPLTDAQLDRLIPVRKAS